MGRSSMMEIEEGHDFVSHLMPPSEELARANGHHSKSANSSSSGGSSKKFLIRGFLILAVLGFFLLFLNDEESSETMIGNNVENVSGKPNPQLKAEQQNQQELTEGDYGKISQNHCPAFCQARLEQRKRHHHGADYRHTQDLLKLVERKHKEVETDLKTKYGSDYYEEIFYKHNKPREGIQSPNGESVERFRRKLQIKVLEVQSKIQEENINLEGCSCQQNEQPQQRERRRLDKTVTLPTVPNHYSQFVWTTAGHSAAAGHGNLFNESYTAFLEYAAQPVFDAIGIRLEARNYAMGGMRSGPELALCQEAVYGTDTDLLTWDFGMTDAGKDQTKILYANRVGIHTNNPAMLYIRVEEYEKDYLAPLEEQGLTTFYMTQKVIEEMEKPVPDMFGMSQEEMDKIPEYVRHFKCQDKIEKGKPDCEEWKYNEVVCADRMHKAPWHPGWRANSLYGNLMAMWLINSLKDALKDLGQVDNPAEKLQELRDSEKEDHDGFRESDFPDEPIKDIMPDKDMMEGDVNPTLIHRSRALCHTALLPSETRYKGILTDTTSHVGPKHYEKGISKDKAECTNSEGWMRIVIEEAERQSWCPVTLKVDFKDFFYTTSDDESNTVVFPNGREIEEYGEDFEPKGILIICFILCDWGKCDDGEMQYEEFKEKKFSLRVNGEKVTELVQLDLCAIMKHKHGYNWEPNSNGQYEISAKVHQQNDDETSFIRITSLILM